MAKVSKYKLQEAVNEVAKVGLAKASVNLGIPRSTLSTRLEIADRDGIVPEETILSEIDQANLESKQTKKQLQIANHQIDDLTKQLLDQEKVKKLILALRDEEKTPPKWILPTSYKKSTPGVPMLLVSDLHWGEVVIADQVHNINKYNMSIASNRFKTLINKTVSLCKRQMANPDYQGFILMLGGDMVSGDIHDELEITNEAPTFPVMLDLINHLIWGIDILLEEFGSVHVVGVAGNHGRTHKKPRYKNRQYTNCDWMIYKLLQTHYKDKKDVTFDIPDGADVIFKAYNTTFFLTHGDNLGVKGGDGIIGLLGPVMRGDYKIRNAQSVMGQPYDVLVMGHWHTYMPTPRIIINGSLKGYDEFAMLALRAKPEAPSQALWMCHPKYGITCHWQVICDKLINHDSNEKAKVFEVI